MRCTLLFKTYILYCRDSRKLKTERDRKALVALQNVILEGQSARMKFYLRFDRNFFPVIVSEARLHSQTIKIERRICFSKWVRFYSKDIKKQGSLCEVKFRLHLEGM